MLRLFCFLLVTVAAGPATATNLFKCKDAEGRVTFTQQACSDGQAGEKVKVTSASKGMLIANPSQVAPSTESSHRKSFNQCGDLTQVDISYLTGNRKIQVGMTAEDVEKSWGRPDQINSSSQGDDQWVYERANYESQYVYVDGSDCVTAWN